MSDQAVFNEAASRLGLALKENQLDKLLTSDFRIFICETSSSYEIPRSTQQELLENLLAVLCSDQLNNNNQIVAATAFCKTISKLIQEPEKVLEFFINLLKEKKFQECIIYICHGILQLNCWKEASKNGDILLEEILMIVQRFCSNLTSTCYFAFKVLLSLLVKTHELYSNGTGISQENFKGILVIVLSNWENPLSGVRQQNSLVLNQLLLFHSNYWNNVLAKTQNESTSETQSNVSVLIKHQSLLNLTLTELSWTMKSKYFLLTSIVQDSSVPQILSKYGDNIIDGLISSLSIPYLVSAGTDLYLALLASLSLEDWYHWFLQPFSKVICQKEISLVVENIFNYWMNQTLKKFPSVFENLISETKQNLFSFISLCKIGKKEGLIKWEVLDVERLRDSLKHYSEKIRSQVISLVCTSSNTSSPPSSEEYSMIQQYLKENINSDDSALRQNLLKSLTSFVLRMRDFLLYINKKKNRNLKNEDELSKHNCFIFLDWLHSFLLFSLDDKCNYQRKITALEIYKIVLAYFGKQQENNQDYKRKSNNNSLNVRAMDDFLNFFKFESEEDKHALFKCLFDEDNNIRFSAVNLLLSHYQMTESNNVYFKTLFTKGMDLSKDQIFYKAESGASIIRVLVIMAYKSQSGRFRVMINNGSDNFINFLLNSAEEQFSQLQEDLLKAASQGSFLYGTLQALQLLTSNSSVAELSLKEDQLKRLLSLIEQITAYFITVLSLKSDSSTEYAPSFGEMGTAIASVVESSSVKHINNVGVADDSMCELQLTPAQQLVLSCIWLNLKECTKLSSMLVSKQLSVSDSQRCVDVVVSVLRRCRHKGAIESAGLALSHITAHLTKSGDPKLINQPQKLLENFLQMLVGPTGATVSRRSAGLAILVHRLITGDSRQKKPMLHMCVLRLLNVAEETVVTEQESLVDLPQSQALHFLRTLVQESSLREHMAQYTLRISLVAATNLASPHWTIRNAALQLFGALVPKLVGQKPNQDQSGGNHYLAFEELYTHAQSLVEMMLEELTLAADSDSTTIHSKLMPLLTLVTNLTLGVQTLLIEDMMNIIQQFQRCFINLFKSKIFNVRKLSSKAHALFATSSKVVKMMEEAVTEVINYIEGRDSVIQSENEMHGYVLSLTYLFVRYEDEKLGMKILLEREKDVYSLLEKFGGKLLSAHCSYFIKVLVFDLKFPIGYNTTVALQSNNNAHSVGYSHFINKNLSHTILTSSEEEIKNTVDEYLLKNYAYDVQISCLKTLKHYVRSKKDLSNVFCRILINSCRDYVLRKRNTTIDPLIFETMLPLFEQNFLRPVNCDEQFFNKDFLDYCLHILSCCDSGSSPPGRTLVLPITCALVASQTEMDLKYLFTSLSTVIKARTEPDCNEDLRLSAAKSIYFFSNILKANRFKDIDCGENIWKACVNLLQDESREVRYETSKCITALLHEQVTFVLNPFVSLECLFQYKIGQYFMELDRFVLNLIKKVYLQTDITCQTTGISNPFDHGIKSIYAEEKTISQLAYSHLLRLLKENKIDEKLNHSVCDLIENLKPGTYLQDY